MPTTRPLSASELLAQSVARGLALPPRLSVADWADAHRVLTRETSPEEGRWRTDRAPYQRAPMEAATDPDVDVVVLYWGSQLGKSEVLNNIVGYHMAHDPAPILFVQPTLELAESYSKDRIEPMIRSSPALAELVGSGRSRDSSDTILHKQFPGGYLVFAGANSPASLASRPIRLVVADEIDKFAASIGRDGDPLKQAFQRTVNFWNAKKILSSTPTVEGVSAIERWFLRSDRREFHVPCPDCGHPQPLEFRPEATADQPATIAWPDGRPEAAEYICQHCGSLWDQGQIRSAVRQGQWVATAEFNGVAGFRLNALYSPWQSLGGLLAEWLEARGRPEEEQTFINLKLGEVWSPQQKAETTPAQLHARREDFGPDNLPAEVLLVTAGVDIQHDRAEVQYLGWGIGDEVWVLDHLRLPGDPTGTRLWEALRAALDRSFDHPSGRSLGVEAAAVDSGNWTQRVYQFALDAQAAFRPVYAIKGVEGQGRPIWKASGARLKSGGRLFLVGVDDAKTEIYAAVARTDPGPGYIHFAGHLDADFFEQLVGAEVIRIKYIRGQPRRVWDNPRRARNEALDCMVYARAARWSISVDYDARAAAFAGGEDEEMTMEELARLYR